MSQCVPRWDLDDNPVTGTTRRFNSNSTAPDVPMLDYDVAHELTWENGQLAMHSLGPPRVLPTKPLNSSTWDHHHNKPPAAGGTLESIVNQATYFPHLTKASLDGGGDELLPWLGHHRAVAAASSATMTMDALVPCSNRSTKVMESMSGLGGTCVVGCSTRVGSCSGTVNTQDDEILLTGKRARAARFPLTAEWSSKEQSASGSDTFGRDSQHVTVDTYEKDFGTVGFTSISLSHGSLENTKATTTDDHDSFCHSKPQEKGAEEDKKKTGKSSVSTKRSRAAAIHNQSERKRRDKINESMKTLQKLLPNSSKTDKASMLDEVIEYLKQLQAQIQMMNRMNMPPMMMNMPPMMLPMAMQQQLQMSMMAQMGMGMGVMDMNTMGRPNIVAIPPVLPNPFMPMTSWDGGSNDRLQAAASAAVMPDPLSTFMACQSQPMTMDAYSRMAAMYQQMQQPPASSTKS